MPRLKPSCSVIVRIRSSNNQILIHIAVDISFDLHPA
jgi:hypothetical protein